MEFIPGIVGYVILMAVRSLVWDGKVPEGVGKARYVIAIGILILMSLPLIYLPTKPEYGIMLNGLVTYGIIKALK